LCSVLEDTGGCFVVSCAKEVGRPRYIHDPLTCMVLVNFDIFSVMKDIQLVTKKIWKNLFHLV
jgi:inosine-uridine nucleoside N-ribohydrolase